MRSSWERLRHPVNSRIYLQGSLGLSLVDSLKNPDSSVHRNQVQLTNPLITKTPSCFFQEIPLIIGPTYQLKAVKWPRYGQHVTCCSKKIGISTPIQQLTTRFASVSCLFVAFHFNRNSTNGKMTIIALHMSCRPRNGHVEVRFNKTTVCSINFATCSTRTDWSPNIQLIISVIALSCDCYAIYSLIYPPFGSPMGHGFNSC